MNDSSQQGHHKRETIQKRNTCKVPIKKIIFPIKINKFKGLV